MKTGRRGFLKALAAVVPAAWLGGKVAAQEDVVPAREELEPIWRIESLEEECAHEGNVKLVVRPWTDDEYASFMEEDMFEILKRDIGKGK